MMLKILIATKLATFMKRIKEDDAFLFTLCLKMK